MEGTKSYIKTILTIFLKKKKKIWGKWVILDPKVTIFLLIVHKERVQDIHANHINGFAQKYSSSVQMFMFGLSIICSHNCGSPLMIFLTFYTKTWLRKCMKIILFFSSKIIIWAKTAHLQSIYITFNFPH